MIVRIIRIVNYIVKCKSHKCDNCSVIINQFCYFSEILGFLIVILNKCAEFSKCMSYNYGYIYVSVVKFCYVSKILRVAYCHSK